MNGAFDIFKRITYDGNVFYILVVHNGAHSSYLAIYNLKNNSTTILDHDYIEGIIFNDGSAAGDLRAICEKQQSALNILKKLQKTP